MRGLFVILVVSCLAACAPRGSVVVDPVARSVGSVVPVFVGSTRAVDPEEGLDFGIGRDLNLRYARYDVSVPPERASGQITWPRRGRAPDPRTDFLTADRALFAEAAGFRTDLRRSIRSPRNRGGEVFVFVHGYNTNFAESVYRLAQLGHDLGTDATLVAYAWPSRGNVLGYVYDRDSVAFSRNGLQRLLNEVIDAGAQKVYLVGHSLGGFLTMETLGQIALTGNQRIRSRLAGVVLVSPDIDIDVFQSQAQTIGRLPQPFVIFTSRKDNALAVSGRLTGRTERLGNVQDVAEIGNLEVTLIDTSAYKVGTGHFNVGNSPALLGMLGRIDEIDRALARDDRRPSGLLPGVVLTVRNATEIILSPVSQIAVRGGR